MATPHIMIASIPKPNNAMLRSFIPLAACPKAASRPRRLPSSHTSSAFYSSTHKSPAYSLSPPAHVSTASKTSAHSKSLPTEPSLTSVTTPIPSLKFPPPNPLPFLYDPTGLSAQPVKKPSCESLGPKKSFYRRKLPEHLISFTSPEGKQLFREMLESGYGEGYFSLVGNFTTQSEPAFCGPSSLAMVLNSLEVDPQRQWKGAWRWYSDELLECCAPSEQVKTKGITFAQFACLSKCHCDVQVRRANQVTLEQFKKDLEMVCSRDDIHMVVSFSRKSLGQTGDGHFSPIGGYVPEAGKVLILDTARYKYPSYFVSVKELWKSLFPIDVETGSSRGYFLLSANKDQPAISLCKIKKSQNGNNLLDTTTTTNKSTPNPDLVVQNMLPNHTNTTTNASSTTPTAPSVSNCKSTAGSVPTGSHIPDKTLSWTSLAQTFCKDLPSRVQQENPQSLRHMVSVVLQGIPHEYAFWVSQQQAHRLRDTTELIESIRATELYMLVSSAFPSQVDGSKNPDSKEVRLAKLQHEGALVFGALFLISSPSTLFLTLPSNVNRQFESLRRRALEPDAEGSKSNRVLKEEADKMRQGIEELVNSFCSCGPSPSPSPSQVNVE